MTVQPLRRNRDFVLLQIGQFLSTTGTQATAIAYPLLVLATTHSPAQAGVVGFANIVPYALFGLFAGVAADRWNRKWVMLVSDAIRIVAIGSLVVSLAFHHLTFAQIAIVAFVEGSAFVFFNIAEVGALRSVVPSVQLPDAAAAEQARFATVTLVGPSLGGALFGLGRAVPFLVDAVSYVFSLASLLAIRTPFQEQRERTRRASARRSPRASASSGSSRSCGRARSSSPARTSPSRGSFSYSSSLRGGTASRASASGRASRSSAPARSSARSPHR